MNLEFNHLLLLVNTGKHQCPDIPEYPFNELYNQKGTSPASTLWLKICLLKRRLNPDLTSSLPPVSGVHLKAGWRDKASPATKPPGSPPPAPRPEAPTIAAGADDDQRRSLEARTCRDTVCSGNGDCVDPSGRTGCTCALGYSGPACEDHVLKSLSGPVVYGVAGLVVGLLMLTAVLGIVIKRRLSGNARSPFVYYYYYKIKARRFDHIETLRTLE